MTPYILRATGGTMLKFGYWNEKTTNAIQAQNELCKLVGKFAQLHTAKNVLAVGRGFPASGMYWKSVYNSNIMCFNVNFLQLKNAVGLVKSSNNNNNIVNSKKTHQALSIYQS
jgi:hypothetical protein